MKNLDFHYDWDKDTPDLGSFQTELSIQERFEAVFKEELPIISEIFHKAFEMAMQDLSRYSRNYQLPSTKAQRTIEYVKGMLFDAFPNLMGIRRSRFYLEKGGFRIYFKKLNTAFKPMNNHTRTSWLILNQLQLFSVEAIKEVFIGYRLNKSKDEIFGVFAVMLSNSERKWTTQLDTLPTNDVAFGHQPSDIAYDDDPMVKPKAEAKVSKSDTL